MIPQILIVDDEEEFTEALAERIKMRDFDVNTVSSGEDAIRAVQTRNYDVVILDVAMPGMSGNETLLEIKQIRPLTEVIMLTGHATVESAIEGLQCGSFDYLKKPCDTEELIDKLNRAYAKKAEQEERIREARVREIISSPRSALRETEDVGARPVRSRAAMSGLEADSVMTGPVDSDTALERLLAGNKRHATSKPAHPNCIFKRSKVRSSGQRPFAVVLGCSDSRVPPEIVFDQGLGDLFVVRVAGNVFDDMALASIEYAAGHLQTPLVLVLGHSDCGAIDAAIKADQTDGQLQKITDAIRPALESAKNAGKMTSEVISRVNTKLVAVRLKDSSHVLRELTDIGRLKIVPAFYDVKTGTVEIVS